MKVTIMVRPLHSALNIYLNNTEQDVNTYKIEVMLTVQVSGPTKGLFGNSGFAHCRQTCVE
jgi:hypothetical protein